MPKLNPVTLQLQSRWVLLPSDEGTSFAVIWDTLVPRWKPWLAHSSYLDVHHCPIFVSFIDSLDCILNWLMLVDCNYHNLSRALSTLTKKHDSRIGILWIVSFVNPNTWIHVKIFVFWWLPWKPYLIDQLRLRASSETLLPHSLLHHAPLFRH